VVHVASIKYLPLFYPFLEIDDDGMCIPCFLMLLHDFGFPCVAQLGVSRLWGNGGAVFSMSAPAVVDSLNWIIRNIGILQGWKYAL
jgi:hypothetical protein